ESTETFAGTFTIGAEVTTPSGIANKLDVTISSPALEVIKDIFQIDTVSEPDILYTGDDQSTPDAEGYPTTLELSRPRLKQTTVLEGSWKTGCVEEYISSWIETHTFAGNTITGVANQWSSNNTCSGPVESTETFAGTFTIGAEVTTTLGIGNKLDVTITSPAPEVLKTIFYIDTVSEPDIFYSGDELGPLDADGYPTTLQLYRPRLKL
ncbi:hypothetical protein KA005_38305, partial [bacterium]|nr:hypothetical protein [bacterium]